MPRGKTTKLPQETIEESLQGYEIQESTSLNWTPLLVMLLVIGAFFLGVATTQLQALQYQNRTTTQNQPDQPEPTQGPVAVALGDITLGNKTAKVEIVEFSDMQCLFCRKFWKETLGQIKKDYIDTGKAIFAFRHYPIEQIHPAAYVSAQAIECANEQGKFWQLHDKLFEEQAKQGEGTIEYTKDDIIRWADEAGINTTKLTACINANKYTKKIENDLTDGQKAGVSGTPAVFVNGRIVVGAQPFSVFKQIIEEELAKN